LRRRAVLRASTPSGHGDRRRVGNVAFNPVRLQQTVHPEAVQPSFLYDYDFDRRSGHQLSLGAHACQQAQQPGTIACGY
jgi:hypothetical protein